jgi:hypothetical protein
MAADKSDEPEDHDGKSHGACLEHFAPKRNSLFPESRIDCEKNARR